MNLRIEDFSAEERRVLDLYKANSPFLNTQFFADHLNQLLRAGTPLDENWAQVALILDGAIAKSLSSSETTLFRATFSDFVEPYVKDGEYICPAYLSTATDAGSIERHFSSGARGRVPAYLEIHCPPNTAMLDLELNKAFGGREFEVLLGRRSKFKILSGIETTDRTKIVEVMGGFYAQNCQMLKCYELLHTGYV